MTTMNLDPQGNLTTGVGGPVEGSMVKLPTGTSSSTNGQESQLTIFGFEDNVIVPAPTPIGPVPVPTPVTFGNSVSVESNSLWKALVDLFLPENNAQPSPLPTCAGDQKKPCK